MRQFIEATVKRSEGSHQLAHIYDNLFNVVTSGGEQNRSEKNATAVTETQ